MTDEGAAILIALYADRTPKERSEEEIERLERELGLGQEEDEEPNQGFQVS